MLEMLSNLQVKHMYTLYIMYTLCICCVKHLYLKVNQETSCYRSPQNRSSNKIVTILLEDLFSDIYSN